MSSRPEGFGARPHLDERSVYIPRGRAEEFIVPLLARAIPEAIERFGRPLEGRRVLDIGCGRQPFRPLLAALGFQYTGLDTQQNEDGTVDVVAAIDQPLPATLLAAPPFHFILGTEILEHIADWDAAFENVSRLLPEGGRVLLTCPQFYQLHEEPYDFWRPTVHALRFYAERHRLRVVELRKLGDGWDVLGTVLGNFSPVPSRGGVAVFHRSARLRDPHRPKGLLPSRSAEDRPALGQGPESALPLEPRGAGEAVRIAMISTMRAAPWGGSEELWFAAARVALARGHEVAVSVFDWPEPAPKVLALRDAGAVLLRRPARPSQLLARFRTPRWIRELERFAPEVVCLSQGAAYECVRQRSTRPLLEWLDGRPIPLVLVVQYNDEEVDLRPRTVEAARRLVRASRHQRVRRPPKPRRGRAPPRDLDSEPRRSCAIP